MGGHSWKYTRRYLREALAAALFLSAVGIGLLIYFSNQSSFHRELTITGGSSSGPRSQIARRLREEAKKQGLKLKVIESEGSKQALERVDRGLLDLALVQGGLDPQRALELELGAMLDLRELLRLQVELSRLKNEALSRFAEGKLEGEALIAGFVAHVNNARNYLTRLILHERDNLENRAQSEQRPAEELWAETMGEWPGEIPSSS